MFIRTFPTRLSMKALAEQIAGLDQAQIYDRVVGVRGLMVEVAGPLQAMSIGAREVRCRPARRRHHFGISLRPPMRAAGSARRSILGCGRSIPF
jgi:hypothetical protein